MLRKKWNTVIVTVLLFLLTYQTILIGNNPVPSNDRNPTSSTQELVTKGIITGDYVIHNPISIDGDADFATQAAAESWPGIGTKTNPYIISGLNITGPTDKQLISVENTRVFFNISNCLLTRGRQGIALDNVRNGYLGHNILSYNDWDGIHLSRSRENYLVNNSIFNNRLRGIWFTRDSGNNNLIANKMDKGLFIYAESLQGCVQGLVANNTIDGKPLVFWQNQTDRTVPADAGQVIIVNCSTITVTGQNTSKVCANMLIIFSSSVKIQQNVLSDGGYGIYLLRSRNCNLSGNIMSRNRFGVFLEDSGSNCILNNTIHDGETGIQCSGGNNLFLNNSIINNDHIGVRVHYTGPSLNQFMMNDFIGNGAQEDGRNNSIYAYNYWSGRTGPDNNSDGIVDIPYNIGNSMYGLPGTKDLYPKTTPNNPVLVHYLSKPKLLSPKGGILYGTELITVRWAASVDYWHENVSYSVSYSPNGGGTWIKIANNLTSTSMMWNITNLPEGTNYRLKVVAMCQEGFTAEDTFRGLILLSQAHPPVSINGNEDFISTAQSKGWKGDGTSQNPYLINNQNITHVYKDLLTIKNTDLHFLINNSYLIVFPDPSGIMPYPQTYATYFENVSNVVISNTMISSSYYGMTLIESENITLLNSVFRSHAYGITIDASYNINIINNSVSWIGTSAISLKSSKTCTISGNNITDAYNSGIFLDSTESTVITRNNISANNQYGISLQAATDTNINQNIITYNENYGLYLGNNVHNTRIFYNDFLQNNLNDTAQAYDAGSNNTFTHNYWADWTRPDANKDGIVDLPYGISGPVSNQDQNPLVSPKALIVPVLPILTTSTQVDTSLTQSNSNEFGSTNSESGTILGFEPFSLIVVVLVLITLIKRFRYFSKKC